MQIKNNRIIILAWITFTPILIGCVSTKTIRTNMDARKNSIVYPMDSKIAEFKCGRSVSIDTVVINPESISNSTRVIRQSGWFVPLVFIYLWNSKNTCIQGKAMIKEDLTEFLTTSLNNEMIRSGTFKVVPGNQSEYQIDVSIDEINTQGPYQAKGKFYFFLMLFGYTFKDQAGPAVSDLTISYQLKKDGEVVHYNTFKSEKSSSQIRKKYYNNKLLQQDYAESMVEILSENFKTNIEQMVADLNSYFGQESSN